MSIKKISEEQLEETVIYIISKERLLEEQKMHERGLINLNNQIKRVEEELKKIEDKLNLFK